MLAAIYWLIINLYGGVLCLAAFFNPKARLFVDGRKGLLKQIRYALIDERRPRIWMHCASLGEFEQGRPLLEKLRARYPNYAFVLTFFSPSGYEVRKDYDGADYVFYLPLDTPGNVHKFLSVIQPKLCLFVKYEFWYFLLSRIARQDIPCILVSAIFRNNQPFFKWYGILHRRMLQCFTHIFVQNEASLHLLERINVQHATKAGDTRFDRVEEARQYVKPIPEIKAFAADDPLLIAGSTWPEDERFLARTLEQLPNNYKLVLVPHEVDEAHIAMVEQLFAGDCCKWSDGVDTAKRVLIVDKVGMLFNLYGSAHVTWIGGGFGKEGVHNVLEAAVQEVVVAFGPIYHQFREAEQLIAYGGGFIFDDSQKFAQQLLAWQKDSFSYDTAASRAREYVLTEIGATAKIIAYLEAKKWLSNS